MQGNRRTFLRHLMLGSAGLGLAGMASPRLWSANGNTPSSSLALCELSLTSSIRSGRLRHLDFPAKAKREWNISMVECASVFFKEKMHDLPYLKEMRQRASDVGVSCLRINILEEGELAGTTRSLREQAVQNHLAWLDVARLIDCNSVSVYLDGTGPESEVTASALESLSFLLEECKQREIKLLVENHLGHSARGIWLAGIANQLNNKDFGLLADTGNFCIQQSIPPTQNPVDLLKVKCLESYDRYQGLTEMLPWTKGFHAKTRKFDGEGRDIETDYSRLSDILEAAGYSGTISIEYEGGVFLPADQCSFFTDDRGISITKELLEKVILKKPSSL